MSTRRRAAAGLIACLLLTSCASTATPADDPADVELQVRLALDDAWASATQGSDARPPDGKVRLALPSGWRYWMQRCMVDSGYDEFDFSLNEGFAGAGQPAQLTGEEGLAWYLCTQQYPEYNVVSSRVTEAELAQLYDYYLSWLVPCIASHGGGVVDLPSRAEFADGGEDQPGWWNPYLSASRPASISLVDEQFEKCEPYPQEVSLTVSP